MITLTIPMKINSEKKHSIRYDAVDKDAAVTSIYLMRKDIPEGKIPLEITAKIEIPHNEQVKIVPDIREIIKALSPEDRTLWDQCRNNMRSVYLNAHNSTIGIAGWKSEDDAFLDLIDIRLALLFDRSGKLNTVNEIVSKEDAKPIEASIEKADDDMKIKQQNEASDASKLLQTWGNN